MTRVDDPAYYAYLVSLAFEQGYYAALDNPSTQRNPFFEWLGSDVRVRLVAASGWDAVTSAEDPEFTGWLTHCEHRRGREVHRNYDFRTVRHHHFEQDQERAFEVMNARFGVAVDTTSELG